MPMGQRIALVLYMDLDPVEGTFHTEESAINQVQKILDGTIKHYNPGVSSFNHHTPVPGATLFPLGDWKQRTTHGRPNWVKEEYFKNPLQDQKPEGD